MYQKHGFALINDLLCFCRFPWQIVSGKKLGNLTENLVGERNLRHLARLLVYTGHMERRVEQVVDWLRSSPIVRCDYSL